MNNNENPPPRGDWMNGCDDGLCSSCRYQHQRGFGDLSTWCIHPSVGTAQQCQANKWLPEAYRLCNGKYYNRHLSADLEPFDFAINPPPLGAWQD